MRSVGVCLPVSLYRKVYIDVSPSLPIMAQYGKAIGLYVDKDILKIIDKVVEEHPDLYHSRSRFINAAVKGRLQQMGIQLPKRPEA